VCSIKVSVLYIDERETHPILKAMSLDGSALLAEVASSRATSRSNQHKQWIQFVIQSISVAFEHCVLRVVVA